MAREIHYEYFMERDKDEPQGQSPHDLESDGEEIIEALRRWFQEVEFRLGHSFIYRLLGGLRGSALQVQELAKHLATYDH